MFARGFLRQLTHPVVRDDRELFRFVARLTFVCAALALAGDVANQLLFFDAWTAAIRSWVITVVLASVIASIAGWGVGRAHMQLHRANLALETLSRTDPLTGLLNRRAFFEAAEAAPAEAMVLVIADIDRFKLINDTRGHLAGDEVLRLVARMMHDALSRFGSLARVGGEEFALVSSGIPLDHLLSELVALRRHMAKTPLVVPGGALSVTFSAGVALRPPGGTVTELYAEADRALYSAKTQGRDQVSLAPTVGVQSDLAAWGLTARQRFPRR
jgi:diguanylate cyclase (GGDEF)-like protein